MGFFRMCSAHSDLRLWVWRRISHSWAVPGDSAYAVSTLAVRIWSLKSLVLLQNASYLPVPIRNRWEGGLGPRLWACDIVRRRIGHYGLQFLRLREAHVVALGILPARASAPQRVFVGIVALVACR